LDWIKQYIDYEVEDRPLDTLPEGRGWGVTVIHIVSDYKVDYLLRDNLSEGRGG
jgi:hypothetical protein